MPLRQTRIIEQSQIRKLVKKINCLAFTVHRLPLTADYWMWDLPIHRKKLLFSLSNKTGCVKYRDCWKTRQSSHSLGWKIESEHEL